MSQQGIRKTKRLLNFQARNQFGTPGGRRAFEKGDTFFELCPIVSKYVQHFSCGDENACRRDSPLSWLRAYGLLHHKQQTFSCVLYAHSQFLCSSVKFELRQPVQPHTFIAQLLVFDETLAQPEFTVVNCSHVGISVFHPPVVTRSLIVLQL